MVVLPKPYPDELLYSVIARFLAYGKGQFPQRGLADRVTIELFGRRCRHRVDLPRYLDRVAEQTRVCWQLSASSIAENHSLFPYFTYAWPEPMRKSTLLALCSDAKSLVSSIQQLHNWRVDPNHHLRFCRECRLRDIDLFGETYWHRAHQLSGVLVCPEHNTGLHDSDALYQSHERHGYRDAMVAADAGEVLGTHTDNVSKRRLSAIAKQCAGMLWHTEGRWHSASVPLWIAYRDTALFSGFLRRDKLLDRKKLLAAFRDFYSDKTLELFGITNDLQWLGAMFGETGQRFHPLEHALVQVFLESLSEQEIQPSPLLRPWRCPNTVVKHAVDYPLSRVEIKDGLRESYALATCRCGFRFTFYGARSDAPDIPFVVRLKQAELTWIEHLLNRAGAGIGHQTLSLEFGVSVHAIKRILQNPQNTYEQVTPEQIQVWIVKWKKLRQLNNVATCKRKHYALWKNLRQYAPEVLRADAANCDELPADSIQRRRPTRGRKQRLQGPHQRSVDWVERDELWSQKLQDAITRLLVAQPVLPLFKARIVREAGLKETILNSLEFLPACKSVLTQTYETEDEYYIRRLRYAAEQMIATNEEVLPSILKRKANIAGRHLNPTVRAEFVRLTTI